MVRAALISVVVKCLAELSRVWQLSWFKLFDCYFVCIGKWYLVTIKHVNFGSYLIAVNGGILVAYCKGYRVE